MKITKDNFPQAKFDVFSLFNDQWALLTAGGPDKYNAMTIGWGTMGTIWGPPKKGKQIITVFVRENRKTNEILLDNDHFTVVSSRKKSQGLRENGQYLRQRRPG